MNTSSNHIDSQIIIILCTLPNNKALALELIQVLLNHKLAACVTVLNEAQSFYYWNEEIKNQIELQLIIKTKNFLKKRVFNKIKEIHPYEIPELLVIPILYGEKNYLNWITTQLK